MNKKARKKVMLVNAPVKTNGNECANLATFPALGIVSLGTRLQKDFPGIEISIADGGLHSKEEIKKQIEDEKPEIVGISVLTPTYAEGLDIAEYAKQNQAKVVLGNDHASLFAGLIMRKRPYVDYVVKAEFGEEPLSWIVSRELGLERKVASPGCGGEKVLLREGDQVRGVQFPKQQLGELYKDSEDIPNLDLIFDDLELASKNYNAKYGHRHKTERKPVIINNVRGCGNAKRKCIYCGIYDLSLNAGDPKFFWETVKKHIETHGINFFYEVCDSFLSFPRYVRQLIATKPFDPRRRDIEFEVYARANDVVGIPNKINWLKQLNVTRVNLGLDSGDDKMLGFLRKNNRNAALSPTQINYEAVRRLAEAGINIHASFPLGSIGETQESLENTLGFIERIAKDYGKSLATLEASELVPLPNSPSWDILLSNENSVFDFNGGREETLAEARIYVDPKTRDLLRERYSNQDVLSTESLARDWTSYFTHINWSDIERAKKRINDTAKRIGAIYGRAL